MKPDSEAYVNGKFPPNPCQLGGVRLQFPNTAGMRFLYVYRISPQVIHNLKIMLEHIWVLIIFGVDVLSKRRCEGKLGAFAEGEG